MSPVMHYPGGYELGIPCLYISILHKRLAANSVSLYKQTTTQVGFSEVCRNWWCFLPHSSTGHRPALQVLELRDMLPGCRQFKQVGAPLRLFSICHLSSGDLFKADGHLTVSWFFPQNPHLTFLKSEDPSRACVKVYLRHPRPWKLSLYQIVFWLLVNCSSCHREPLY